MFKRNWYFILRKGSGKTAVDMYMYRHKGKFKVDHQLHDCYLMHWWTAKWHLMMFSLPAWIKHNANMFAYRNPYGRVHLQQLHTKKLDAI
jgi:hypothetical protein